LLLGIYQYLYLFTKLETCNKTRKGKTMASLKDSIKLRAHLPINQNKTVQDAVKFFCDHNISATMVSNDEGNIIGIISEKDIVRKVLYKNLDPKNVHIKEIMNARLIYVDENEDIKIAKMLMFMNGVRHLIMVDENKQVIGLLSMRDLIESDLTESKELLRRINDIYYEHAHQPEWRISSNRVIIGNTDITPDPIAEEIINSYKI